jgi:hypothetical protein
LTNSFTNPNQFSLQDFLGYLIPGGFFIFGLGIVHQNAFVNFQMQKAFTLVAEFYHNTSLAGIVFLVILAYITGHFLSYISSMTIEKYSEWTIGYPSRYIFEINRLPSWQMGYYLYFKRYFNPLIVNNRNAEEVRKAAKLSIKMQRLFIVIFLLPISSLIILLVFAGMNDTFKKGVMPDLASILKRKADKKLKSLGHKNKKSDPYHGELFKLLYHYVLEHKPQHRSKMNHYHALYVYTRTIALSFVIFFWATILIHRKCLCFGVYWFTLLVIAVFASLFYLAFVKFYRKFTLEGYMAVATPELKTPLK